MTNKNIVLLIILVAIVIGVGTYLFKPQTSQGKIVFGITDAASNMEGISSVLVTVDKVEIHNTSNNWVTVSSETKEYDLLALKQSGAVSLLVNTNVDVGIYDQVRLIVSKVIVVQNGVQEEAKLPSGELKIVGNIVVNADKTSSVVFDFIADKSLHMTGNGKFIFAPVIKIKKQNDAKVELKSNNEIDIKDDEKENDEDVGMDEKGEVRNNFELKGKFSIDADDNIKFESKDNDDENDEEDKEEDKTETKNESDDLVFNFTAQNNSSTSGTATISKEDKKIKVTLKLKNSILGLLTPTEPAHIHLGNCANIGNVKYPLNSVVDGKSVTMLNVSLADFKAELPLAINVHKSVAESNIFIACTNLVWLPLN